MAIQDSFERLPTQAELLLLETIEGKEAVAMGGVYGKDLSLVQSVSDDPELLQRRAAHALDGVRSALESAEQRLPEVGITEEERQALILHILEMNRSQREQHLEDRTKKLRTQVEFLIEHATPEQLAAFDEQFPTYTSFDTSEVRLLMDDELQTPAPKTDAFEWARRFASSVGKLAGTALLRTVARPSVKEQA